MAQSPEQFSVVRRGYDRDQVNLALIELHAQQDELTEQVAVLEVELKSAREAGEKAAQESLLTLKDPQRLAEVVGREASEILNTASEAAQAVRKRAEIVAAEMIEKARKEAAEIEQQAQVAAEHELEESREGMKELIERSRAQADEILRAAELSSQGTIDAAKQEGRSLVIRAREHVAKLRREQEQGLADLREEVAQLVVRRDAILHLFRAAQELLSGAERLADAVDRATQTDSYDISDELVGVVEALTHATLPSLELDGAILQELESDDQELAVEAEPEPIENVPFAQSEGEDDKLGPPGSVVELEDEELVDEFVVVLEEMERFEGPAQEAVAEVLVESEIESVGQERVSHPASRVGDVAHDERLSRLEALFAELRSEPKQVGHAISDSVDSIDSDAGWQERFEQICRPVLDEFSKKLKRFGQDDFAEIRVILARSGLDEAYEFLTAPAEKERLEVLESYFRAAQEAGARFGGINDWDSSNVDSELVGEALREFNEATRLRAAQIVQQADSVEDAEREASALYREVRRGRLDEIARDRALGAIGIIVRANSRATGFRWLPMAGSRPCPDCEDNMLAETNPQDEDFPTAHRFPPAHPGCHCFLIPVTA